MLVVLYFCLALGGAPQVGSGAMTGIVVDASGTTVPGARVTITNTATGQQRATISSGTGLFAASSLPPGDYRVEVALDGFSPVSRTGLRVSTGETTRADIQLSPGGINERVTVTAPAPLLRTETASLGASVP